MHSDLKGNSRMLTTFLPILLNVLGCPREPSLIRGVFLSSDLVDFTSHVQVTSLFFWFCFDYNRDYNADFFNSYFPLY